MAETEKGTSYIPQIEEAWDALIKSHKTKLALGLKLGDVLNDAKEAVGHTHWTEWLKKHVPQISHRTANVYMNLAKNKDKFSEAANSQRAAISGARDDLSIRDAIAAINKKDGGGQDANKGAGTGGKGKGGGRSKGATSAANQDMDDVDTFNATWDDFSPMQRRAFVAAHAEELQAPASKPLEEELKALAEAQLVKLLVQTFSVEYLNDFNVQLTEHLNKANEEPTKPKAELQVSADDRIAA